MKPARPRRAREGALESRFPLGAGVVLGVFAALVILERRRPLRPSVEPRQRHDMRNLAMAAVAALAVRAVEEPLLRPAAELAVRRRWGLLPRLALPATLETALALVLLDWTLYLWHVLTHRVPFLWRFHLVHHVDLDLTASTALRFHFAELALSTPWRAAQVLLIGVPPRTLVLWQKALLVSVLFHHSNLRLPEGVERIVQRFIVTPRMHGIHHSARPEHTSSNWSSGLTAWDRLHGTWRVDVPQDRITIGVPAYRSPAELRIGGILALPFLRQRPAWTLPTDRA
jgi:sterol desaturase/sphingolipid hydroxylase (fatty acid hydroxylase superfamily)